MAIVVKSFFFTLIFCFGFYLTYNQVFNGFPSDIETHINLIGGFNVETTYPIWHMLVYCVSEIVSIKIRESAVIVTAVVILVLAMVIYKILKYSLMEELLHIPENRKEYLFLCATFSLLIMTAVYIPFFNKFVILGQPSCGVWHNVTLLMVKPIAFLSFFYTVEYFEKKSIKSVLIALSMTLLSIYAKPSYIVAFLPTVLIFFPMFIMRQTGFNIIQLFSHFGELFKRFKNELFFLAVLTLFSSIILYGQFSAVYMNDSGDTGKESKVIFDFLGVWSLFTPSVAGSLLLSYLFPLTVFFLVKGKKSNAYLLAMIMSIISILLLALFAEEGVRYKHGNFGWSQLLSVQLLFIFSIVEFIKKYAQLKDWKKYILSTALSLHFISGVFYLIKVSSGLFYG